jgi:iron complex outermembrane receptor protein
MRHFISIVTLPVFLIFTQGFPLAQEKEVTLEEVVVTATRDVEDVRKVPASVTVITKEEIDESHVETVVDLMRDRVGTVVRDFYGTGKKASVDIRGYGETASLNTLVLVDGRRVNEIDLSGVDWTQIPLDQIERIEIVRGAGSVLYGDNAVGGVVNIITRRPEKPFAFQVGVSLGSYNYNNETGSVSGKWGPLSAILGFGYHATDGYRDNGLLRDKNIGGNIIYDLNDSVTFGLSGAFFRSKEGLPGGLTQTEIDLLGRRATLTPDNQANTDDGYGNFGMKIRLWDAGRIEADLSYRDRQLDNVLDFPLDFYQYTDERSLKTWGFTPRYLLEKPIGRFANKFTFGVDLYRSDSEVNSETVFLGFPSSNESDIIKKDLGLYFYDEFSILENLNLSLGYRYEWATYDISQKNPDLEDTTNYGEPAWNVGLTYLVDKSLSAFISARRSFRFPTTDELILVYPVARVNPAMKPQTGYDYEAGLRYALTDKIEAGITGFWINTTDEIFFNPVTFVNANYPKTRRLGVELTGRATPLSWFSMWANYGYIQPLLLGNVFDGNDIPGVPRNKGSIGADVGPFKGFLFTAKANFIGSSYLISDFANRFGKQGEYYTVDLRFSYTWKGLNAFFGVNNVTNQQYSQWAVTNATGTRQLYYPSPERNYIGGISYSF